MRRILYFGLAVVLLAAHITFSVEASEPTTKLKVLVDESRVYSVPEEVRDAYVAEIEKELEELSALLSQMGIDVTIEVACDEKYSFENVGEPWGFGLAGARIKDTAAVTIRSSGKLSYSTLRAYDVLVLASFENLYNSDEVDAIKKFVENGGGLLLMADVESENNSVSKAFDVLFFSDRAAIADGKAEKIANENHMFYVDDIRSHEITKDINRIALIGGIPLVDYKSGQVLIRTGENSWIDREGDGFGKKGSEEEQGPLDILLAMEKGKGRAVFFGGAMSFWNSAVLQSEQENLDLFENSIEWLGEPGGPYKQYKVLNEQAQNVLSIAESLYETHEFSEAKEEFERAIKFFEESNEVYTNSEASEGIEKAEGYLEKCAKGLEANQLFSKAETLFENREYENAIKEYEKAIPLYEEIQYTERVDECTTKIDESHQWISLRDEASSLFSQAEEAFSKAPSTFDITGFEAARSLYEQAKSTWEEYGDPAQVTICEEKIAECNDEIAHIERTKMIVIIAGVAVAAGLVVVGVIFIRRRKQ